MYSPSSKGPSSIPWSSPSLNLKVFYVRLTNCEFHKSSPEHLTLIYTPLSPETIVDVNGRRSGLSTAFVSSTLRRDRIDEKSEEAIFVSTDDIRMTESMRFEVYGRQNLLFYGELELSVIKKWKMKCQPVMSGGFYLVKGEQFVRCEVSWPAIEVYVTGFFSGSAIIMTKTLHLGKKKKKKKLILDSVPEDEATGIVKKVLPKGPQQLMKSDGIPPENDEYNSSFYGRSDAEYSKGDDGGLSLFNAGVSVGVGIGLSICLCIGIGTTLLFRTYNSTATNFKRLL